MLENFTHYLTTLVIILKGVAKIGNPEKLGVFIVIGVLIILGTVFNHKAEKLLKYFKA